MRPSMQSSIRPPGLVLALIALSPILGAACGSAPPPPPPAPIVTAPPPAATAAVVAPPEEPRIPREEALARGRALAAEWANVRWDENRMNAWLSERGLDETHTRRLLESVARPCLDQRDGDTPPCKEIADDTKEAGKAAEVLAAVLGEIADPATLGGATARLLVRLDARAYWRADWAMERILVRRMEATPGACAPPSAAEIEAAKRSIADLAILDPGPAKASPGSPAPAPAARWPTAQELDDLAYFYAAIAASGPEVGRPAEGSGSPLPANHPDLAARKRLQDELRSALLDGDVERHARAAEAYLKTLGYPGPLRLGEEADMRWGGAAASYVVRDAARSAELLGKYDISEALFRRAMPGGGGCGTSTPSRRDDQIRGAIRSAEQRGGCRAALAERLFSVEHDQHHAYGTERLARAGFDVPRLYAGALLTIGRDDAAALDRALKALPARSSAALARLARLGPEAWAERVRALPGYADTARGASIDRLLGLAERGTSGARVEALDALARLAEERGYDPCLETELRFGSHRSSSSRMERNVRGVMGDCSTRIPARTIDSALGRISAMAGDPDTGVREAVAVALGRLGSPRSKPVLAKLAKDPFDAGGQVCTSEGDKPSVCGPNRPIARAAEDALKELAEAEKRRKEQRASRPRKRK